MNKEILKSILKTESVSFSYEEIQQMLDEELEKSPDEMDTQLVDLCIDVLSMQNAPEKKETKKHKKISVKKILLIAAVISIIAALAIPVGADVLGIEADGNIIKVIENYIRVNLSGGDEYNLSEELENYNIPALLIPSRFFESDCIINDVQVTGDNSCCFAFNLTELNSDGYIYVSKLDGVLEFKNDYTNLYAEVEQLKQLQINNMDVFVYSSVDGVVVKYVSDDISFSILFNSINIYDVIEIVEKF